MHDGMIDLRSDTLTLPTPEMFEAIVTAPLGDDSRDGDPTVLALEAEAAARFGKEAAVLTISGTMSNTLALRTHCEPGAAAVLHELAHVYTTEWSAMAATCGLLVMPVPGTHGVPDTDRIEAALRKATGSGFPARPVVCLENTHNAAGGTVMDGATTARVADVAHRGGAVVHLDGARIFHAAVALDVDVRTLVAPVDSISVCLSKGLSAPVGSLLIGSRAFIQRARAVRRSFGAAMRQAGIIAAPGLVAIRTMVSRLRDDHALARRLAVGLSTIPGVAVDLATVQTNIVNVSTRATGLSPAAFHDRLMARGVRALPGAGSHLRFVVYRGITATHIDRAIDAVAMVARHAAEPHDA